MRTLRPTLTFIENNLFQPSDDLIQRWTGGEPLPPGVADTLAANPDARARRADLERAESEEDAEIPGETLAVPPMPTKLRALIHRRVAARAAAFDPIPQAGQIVRVDEVRGPDGLLETIDLPQPLAVLLAEPTTIDRVWSGWLVATETDYAGPDDLLLGPEDEPCDPLARTVQTWNPIRVYLPSVSRVLAQLKPERLEAIRALAATRTAPAASAADSAQPGRVVSRQAGSHAILTGAPLGNDDDPRRAYRNLYARAVQTFLEPPVALAQAAATPLTLALSPTNGREGKRLWLDRLVGVLRDWADGCGETLAPIAPLAQPMSGGAATDPGEARYELGGRVRLRLRADAPPFVQVRVERLAATAPLRVEWREAGELLLKAPLDLDHPAVELTVDPGRPSELTLVDEAGDVLSRFPLGRADE
ncbi:MAG: hypothetical protein P9F19_12300 [Candidatus Contendobacter sp.]|nr:hypothetical protein [Candidatus Contendobacter sp.]